MHAGETFRNLSVTLRENKIQNSVDSLNVSADKKFELT